MYFLVFWKLCPRTVQNILPIYARDTWHKDKKEIVDKSAIAGLINNAVLTKKAATLATKTELKTEQTKTVKFQVFDSSYFCSKSNFEDDSTQNYLVFSQFMGTLKRLIILIIFQHRILKNCLMKALSLLPSLTIVLNNR